MFQFFLFFWEPQLGLHLGHAHIVHQVLEDLLQCLKTVTPYLYFPLFWYEQQLQHHFLVGVVKFKFKWVDVLKVFLLLLSPLHEKSLTDPFDVSGIPLHKFKPGSTHNLHIIILVILILPEFREFCLKGTNLVYF